MSHLIATCALVPYQSTIPYLPNLKMVRTRGPNHIVNNLSSISRPIIAQSESREGSPSTELCEPRLRPGFSWFNYPHNLPCIIPDIFEVHLVYYTSSFLQPLPSMTVCLHYLLGIRCKIPGDLFGRPDFPRLKYSRLSLWMSLRNLGFHWIRAIALFIGGFTSVFGSPQGGACLHQVLHGCRAHKGVAIFTDESAGIMILYTRF